MSLRKISQIIKCPDCRCIDEHCPDYQALRQEAIKWLKELDQYSEQENAEFRQEQLRLIICIDKYDSTYIDEISVVIKFIKYFFEIKDEEYK